MGIEGGTAGRAWSLSGKRVLVTGASGFLGSHLVERLNEEGAIVGALSRTIGKLAQLEIEDYDFIQCDLRKADRTISEVVRFRPEIVFHFAAHPDGKESFHQGESAVDNNIRGTLNLLEALRQAGSKTLLYGDSCKVYGNCEVPYRESTPIAPTSSYAIAKAAGWQLCLLYQRVHLLSAVALRPTMICGPRQNYNLFTFLVDGVLDGKKALTLDGGSQTRDPLYVDDAVDAFLMAAEKAPEISGRVLALGGGRETTVVDLARLTMDVMEAPVEIRADSRRARPTEIWRSYCDNEEIADAVGWRPQTSLREAVERTVEAVMEEREAAAAVVDDSEARAVRARLARAALGASRNAP